MKEKIKRLAKDHKFQIGVITGLGTAYLIGSWSNSSNAKKGFMTVRPWMDETEEWVFENLAGEIFGIEKNVG